MPKLNGIEATRQLKKRHSATAVLILTAYDTDQYVMALLEAGAAGYLLKNVRGNQLVQAIHDVYTGESVLQLSTAKRVIDQLALKIAQKEEIPTADSVTKRELEILKLAAKGISNKDIADNLDLSVRTIQTHLSNIFKKLNAASRTEAILYGLKRNWLTMEDLP